MYLRDTNKVVEDIGEVLRNSFDASGIEEIYNQVCSTQIIYRGDELFEVFSVEDKVVIPQRNDDVVYKILELPGYTAKVAPVDLSEEELQQSDYTSVSIEYLEHV